MNKDLIDDLFGRFREIPLELGNMGHSVTGVCLSYRNRKDGLFKDGEVRWHSINAGKLKFAGLIHFIRKAKKYAASADLIWACSDSFYGIIGHALSRRYRIPFIFDLYDNFEYYFTAKLPFVRQLYRYAARHCEAVTCVSEPLATLVKKSYGRKKSVFILENAVRKDLFRPLDRSSCRRLLHLPQDGKLIGTAGALTKNRGIEYLFDAYFKLKTLHPDLHLVIAGPRDISIPKDERIHDLGSLPLENVPYLFNALDVAVVCIKDDTFGRYCFPQKAREIMACDIPIAASNVGSLKTMFSKHSEWLFEPESVDSLIRAVNHRLNERITNYGPMPSWSDLAKNFSRLIQAIPADKPPYFEDEPSL